MAKGRRGRLTPEKYVEGILSGNRVILSRAITVIESSLDSDRELANQVVDTCIKHSGNSYRIGISGVPGVGKSTFIEGFGSFLIDNGGSVAVLSIDPTSSRSMGSILGDKTRMELLSTNPKAYIRPSPTGGSLGGVANKTREAMILCEAAGYSHILIETVGVGQSEVKVRDMVDFFLLLMLPNAGDELQGIKRGIIEMADLMVVNKADGNLKKLAEQAKASYSRALHFFPSHESGWKPGLLTCSALHKQGFGDILQKLKDYQHLTRENKFWGQNRNSQVITWMNDSISNFLHSSFQKDEKVKNLVKEMEEKIKLKEISPLHAAEILFFKWKNQ